MSACSRWLSGAIPPEPYAPNPPAPRQECQPNHYTIHPSFPMPSPSKLLLLRNTLCKCLLLQHVTFAAKAPKMPGRVATGFPLPSTGRGIEGEGWSYPEPPPVRFFLYQPHPGSRLNTENFPQNPRNITFLHWCRQVWEKISARMGRAALWGCLAKPFLRGARDVLRRTKTPWQGRNISCE